MFCVAQTPTPARAYAQRAATLRLEDAMAIPSRPVRSHLPLMDIVIFRSAPTSPNSLHYRSPKGEGNYDLCMKGFTNPDALEDQSRCDAAPGRLPSRQPRGPAMAHTDQPQVEAVLERLIAFDTVSAYSNLALCDYVISYLDALHIPARTSPDASGSECDMLSPI